MECRGLGALIAEKFAAEGANVVVNYVSSKERATEVAEKIKTDYGVKAHVIQAVRSACMTTVDTNMC